MVVNVDVESESGSGIESGGRDGGHRGWEVGVGPFGGGAELNVEVVVLRASCEIGDGAVGCCKWYQNSPVPRGGKESGGGGSGGDGDRTASAGMCPRGLLLLVLKMGRGCFRRMETLMRRQ